MPNPELPADNSEEDEDGVISQERLKQIISETAHPTKFRDACVKMFEKYKAHIADHFQSGPSYPPGRGQRFHK
ncbi:MAG: hypothetical protein K2Y22_14725 [Candidatus Obscuribacterales bacterium]|nr:hypothetical protein [Candidatus Obscuribacterales bacterium]